MTYEPPALSEVGSLRELTLGKGFWGDDDTLIKIGRFEITYGTDPSS